MIRMAKKQVRRKDGDKLRLALYSHDRTVRAQVLQALGDRLDDELPPVEIAEYATPAALIAAIDQQPVDCVILDGEAVPVGGFGVGHQIKDEIPSPPPTVLLVARPGDSWLATWSRADGVATLPVDPLTLPALVADVVKADRAGTLADTTIVPGAASRHE